MLPDPVGWIVWPAAAGLALLALACWVNPYPGRPTPPAPDAPVPEPKREARIMAPVTIDLTAHPDLAAALQHLLDTSADADTAAAATGGTAADVQAKQQALAASQQADAAADATLRLKNAAKADALANVVAVATGDFPAAAPTSSGGGAAPEQAPAPTVVVAPAPDAGGAPGVPVPGPAVPAVAGNDPGAAGA